MHAQTEGERQNPPRPGFPVSRGSVTLLTDDAVILFYELDGPDDVEQLHDPGRFLGSACTSGREEVVEARPGRFRLDDAPIVELPVEDCLFGNGVPFASARLFGVPAGVQESVSREFGEERKKRGSRSDGVGECDSSEYPVPVPPSTLSVAVAVRVADPRRECRVSRACHARGRRRRRRRSGGRWLR